MIIPHENIFMGWLVIFPFPFLAAAGVERRDEGYIKVVVYGCCCLPRCLIRFLTPVIHAVMSCIIYE